MEYTKGEWWIEEGDFGYTIKAEQSIVSGFDEDADIEIAEINTYLKEAEANAHLIAAAVNACIKLNPNNPIAVAESIPDLYEALKLALGKSHNPAVERILMQAISLVEEK